MGCNSNSGIKAGTPNSLAAMKKVQFNERKKDTNFVGEFPFSFENYLFVVFLTMKNEFEYIS